MTNRINHVYVFLLFLILISRFLPHPPNFTPVLAIFSLGGHYSLLPALLTYMFTDVFLGWHNFMIWVYASLFVIAYLQKGPIISSLIFFTITNFGVWTSGWYGYSIEGLLACYLAAIPFFVNTLTSTVIFHIILKHVIEKYTTETDINFFNSYIYFFRQSRT